MEDFLPLHPGSTEPLPSIDFISGHKLVMHELINGAAVCMTKTNSINHSDSGVLILKNLVVAQAADMTGPSTLENTGHIMLGTVGVQIILHLRDCIISTRHDLSAVIGKLPGVLLGKLLTSRVRCCEHHDDLRIQTDVELIAKLNCPLKGLLKIIVKSILNALNHNLVSGRIVPNVHDVQDISFLEFLHVSDHTAVQALAQVSTCIVVAVITGLTKNGRCCHELHASNGVNLVAVPIHEVLMGLCHAKPLIGPGVLNCITNSAHNAPSLYGYNNLFIYTP